MKNIQLKHNAEHNLLFGKDKTMIIESAYKALEVDENYKATEPFWRYLAIRVNGHEYRIAFEDNKVYGLPLVRQWSIDHKIESDVLCKYTNELLRFDCSNGLCGIRSFENDSMIWEYLFKPLGLSKESIFDRKHNWSMGSYELKELLANADIDYEIIMEGIY